MLFGHTCAAVLLLACQAISVHWVEVVAELATVFDGWAAECGRPLKLGTAPCGALQVTDSDHKPVYAQLTVRLPACKHDAKRARSLDIISSITATAVQSPTLQVRHRLCLAVRLPAGCCRSLLPCDVKLGLSAAERRREQMIAYLVSWHQPTAWGCHWTL